MEFSEWLMEKFKEWEKTQYRGRSSIAAFARYLGVRQPSLSRWINGDNPPEIDSAITLAEKLGPEIYKVLGIANPEGSMGIVIPLVGRVMAGEPIPMPPSDFSNFDPESTVIIAKSWLPKNINTKELFALEVEGDSMKDMGIENGTTIIISKQETADSGDIVVAYFDGDDSSTLKRFYRDNGHIRLQPENPAYQPIIVDADKVRIVGKLVMSIKIYK